MNCKKSCVLLGFLLSMIWTIQAQKLTSVNYASMVNTTIGSQGKGFGINEGYLEAGYTFPGSMYPFGMVQFTPTFFNKEKGFVVNQMSGAGCEHMGNFPTLPLTGMLLTSPDSMLHLNPKYNILNATAGYFKVSLGNGVETRLTVTPRTGMATYKYPMGTDKGTIVIGSGINGTKISEAHIKIIGKNSCEGYADGGSFCGSFAGYKIYFVAQFDRDAILTGTWKDGNIGNGVDTVNGPISGAWLTFDVSKKKNIQYKFGISYVSLQNARENLKKENAGWNFEAVKDAAITAWNKYLGRIEVAGGTKDYTTQFYTHLYHAFAHPNVCNDVNGEYMGSDNKVHKIIGKNYYTAFSNWDTYRTQVQLISMLAPDETSDMMKSIVEFAEQSGGGFPRWVLGNFETGIMQGDPTSILVANAYTFGAKDFDTRKALKIMRLGAEIPGTKSQQILTRPDLKQYLDKGYIAASMSLEYASADFAIGQFAKQAFNDNDLYNKYLVRSQSWKNLYNPQTNWLQSKNENGQWKKYDEDWREASYKSYFWMVPHNLKGLIDTIGGKAIAEKRLDSFFTKINASYSQEWFASGNEPDFQVPWIYNWTDAPYKTNDIIRRIIKEQYTNRAGGLPGNDDLGAMGAWYVFAGIGLYPMVPGYGGFSISSPLFPVIKIHLKKGILVISGGSQVKPYLSSLKINGLPWNSTWIDWSNICKGGKMEFNLSDTPNKEWGTRIAPPSFN